MPTVLVQLYGIMPPMRLDIRSVPIPAHDADKVETLPPGRLVVELGEDDRLRTDELLGELEEAGLKLADVHLGHRRLEDGREVPILNLRFDSEGEAFPPPPRHARFFQAWTNKLFSRSWAAIRVYVHEQIICVNLLNAYPLDPDHEPLSVREHLTVEA